MPLSGTLDSKHAALQEIIRNLKSLIVAFSGGIDSTLVLKVSYDVLGSQCLAVTADSPSVPRKELKEAKRIAKSIGVKHIFIKTSELQNQNYRQNPANRCYFCKSELYTKLTEVAQKQGFVFIANGTNLDDQSDYRPGLQAAQEFQVVSPLKEAKLTKSEVRILAQHLGLKIWDKPASPCLSSRIPYGSPVTVKKLAMIEQAEDYLKSCGLKDLRVRHFGERARIEVPNEALMLINKKQKQILLKFKTIGFQEIDITEFRSGALNLALSSDV